MGQFEYTVALARPLPSKAAKALAREFLLDKEIKMAELTEEQAKVVKHLIAQGALMERERILEDLEKEANNGTLTIALFKLRNIVNDTEESEN
jgi:ribosomal protein S13